MMLILGLLLVLAPLSSAYITHIDANEEQCFFDIVGKGTEIGLEFEVTKGGALDIGITIWGAGNELYFNRERETSVKYTMKAPHTGNYSYCFSNKMSTMTSKEVKFSVDVKPPPPPSERPPVELLEKMIGDLKTLIIDVKHEQEYMEVRERKHRDLNDSTNSRVLNWALIWAVIVVSITVGQVWYLKRFFEVRNVV